MDKLKYLILVSFLTVSFLKLSLLLAIVLFGILLLTADFKGLFSEFKILFVIIFIGIMLGLDNDTYLVLKDVFYLLVPVMFYTIGKMLFTSLPLKEFYKAIILSGVLVTILKLCVSVYTFGISIISNPYGARYINGFLFTSPTVAVAIGLLVVCKFFNVRLFSNRIFWIMVSVNSFGLYLSASRTYYLILILFLLATILFKYRKRVFFMFFWMVSSLVILFFVLNFSFSSQDKSFLSKVVNSVNEIKADEYTNDEEINTRYRGYESFRAMQTFDNSSLSEQIFGNLGRLIDLKVFIKLGSEEFQFIPILHNGYLYLLIKSGLVGLLFFILFYTRLLSESVKALKSHHPPLAFWSLVLLSSILSLLFSNYVVSGLFNIEMAIFNITVGYLYSLIKLEISNNSKISWDVIKFQ